MARGEQPHSQHKTGVPIETSAQQEHSTSINDIWATRVGLGIPGEAGQLLQTGTRGEESLSLSGSCLCFIAVLAQLKVVCDF